MTEQIGTVVLVCLVIVFRGLYVLLNSWLVQTMERLSAAFRSDIADIDRVSRGRASLAVLRVSSVLVWVGAGGTFASGVVKGLTPMWEGLLPERTLGMVLLIGYCILVSVYYYMRDELVGWWKRLVQLSGDRI